ncbi:CaiB/BaiF CoA-transferase family protein [Acidovorax sp. MR-S7]|uniref:CaiB/BaiF CoA transferase family protein n=1 Tax=Acidovorax sp. MR-S7 TaxID=1268622 RepID=UPI000368C510|nr:CaiB/BaiF CoA-transferase family protein [Acidovorax sp. MR-S7]GAD24564.1 predicted acyl-CoA transferases/carnitine dehydratase [Acidovorax sp. MR-S7]
MKDSTGVLAGVKVLEFDAIGPVPWCARLLTGMGADVVHVVRPGSSAPEDESDYIRGGRTVVTLDLKEPQDVHRALRLIANADVLLEGMRPGVMERLGLGPDDCFRVNRALVYGRMTGWGQEGPLAKRAGHDINYIALTGALHAIGPRERPAVPLNVVGDYGGGATFLAIGLLAGLLRARATGKGEVVDAAMIDGAAALMGPCYSKLAAGRWNDARGANILDGGAPWYDVYETRDGGHMAVGAIEPRFYSELLAGLGIDEDTLPVRTEQKNWPEIRARMAKAFRSRTRDEWAAILEPRDACASPVLSLTEAPSHPHNVARQTFSMWEGNWIPAPSPRVGAMQPHERRSRPDSPEAVLRRWNNASLIF